MNIVSDQLKQIIEIAKKGVRISERVERVQDSDREDFHELINRVGHLEVELRTLKDTVSKIPGLTQDKVAEAVAPVLDGTDALKKVISKKEVIAMDTIEIKKQERPWWALGRIF